MLRPVETAHAGIGLGPDNEIQGGKAKFQRSRMYSGQAPPIDECAHNATVAEMWQDGRHPRFVEAEKLSVGHLARRLANSRRRRPVTFPAMFTL
jgi:hypothetical protein